MAVTSDDKGRGVAKKKSARSTTPKKTVKRRSPAAAALAEPRFRKRVVKAAKTYRRKGRVELIEDEDL
ncbi:MAG: hypothetical protein ACR2J1_10760 [Methyloceanibacter sp.]|uniref:hypothetical protein n=1 Tax=Methyloceanibacter sp. TaxID=1965321 RepID=UPI003D9BFDC8